MKITDFKELLKKEKIPINDSRPSDLQYVKKLIGENIDFGCRIKNGKCKSNMGIHCCCHSCYDKVGFLKVICKDNLLKYAKNFSVNTGFWRKDEGCNLPYKLRSSMCVFWNCHDNAETHYALSYLCGMFDRQEKKRQNELLNYQKIKTEIIDGGC